jgi:hypothetical protein
MADSAAPQNLGQFAPAQSWSASARKARKWHFSSPLVEVRTPGAHTHSNFPSLAEAQLGQSIGGDAHHKDDHQKYHVHRNPAMAEAIGVVMSGQPARSIETAEWPQCPPRFRNSRGHWDKKIFSVFAGVAPRLVFTSFCSGRQFADTVDCFMSRCYCDISDMSIFCAFIPILGGA